MKHDFAAPVGLGLRAFSFLGHEIKVIAYIDGFNLYHAVKATGARHHQWLNLRSLCEVFAPKSHFDIRNIYYFSAYATWLPDAFRRHREYVKALESCGVTPVLSQFKEKSRGCRSCGSRWIGHEEKETDVSIAVQMIDDAYRNQFDRALLISADSDLAPPIRTVLDRFPEKQIRVITPVNRNHSWALVNAAGGLKSAKKMTSTHLDMALLPNEVRDADGNLVAMRPESYLPPA